MVASGWDKCDELYINRRSNVENNAGCMHRRGQIWVFIYKKRQKLREANRKRKKKRSIYSSSAAFSHSLFRFLFPACFPTKSRYLSFQFQASIHYFFPPTTTLTALVEGKARESTIPAGVSCRMQWHAEGFAEE